MAKDAGLDLYSLRFEDASVARKAWCAPRAALLQHRCARTRVLRALP
jgi:hypothetical protein